MEHIEHIIPLDSDFSVSGFQPYVLDLSSAGLAEEEDVFTLVFVVMKRNQGLLAALPMHGLSDEVLQSGTVADRTDLVGPHLNTKVDAALMSEEAPASDPLALDGQSVDVLLVDFSSDIAVYMKALTAPSQLQGILLFDPSEIGFIPSPSSLSSIAIAWTMDVAQSAPERMQFYSADEVPETPHPGTEEALPEADSPSGATTARAPKSSRLGYWKRVSPNFCPEEANGGHFGRQPGEVVSGLAGHHHTAAGSQFPHCSDRSQCGQPPRQVIHLEAALKQLSFGWIIECCGPPGLGQGDAPTEKFVNTREGGAKESLHREGDKRDGHGLPREPCLGASSLGAIPSLDSFGCADGKWRPQFGVAFWEWAIQQRFNRARKTQERVSTAQGHLLHQCDPEYVQEDAPNYACGGGCGCIDPAWGYTTLVPGALWGLREDTRPGLHHLAGLNCDGLHAARELPSCHGLSGTPLCLSGAIGNGQWEDGPWIGFGFGGGPPTLPLLSPVHCSFSEPQTICSDGQPEVGDSGPAVLEGVRHHSHTASGSGLSKSTSNPEPIDTSHHKPKAQAKAKSMGKGKANRATAGTGGGIDRSLSDEARLTEDISFLQFLASLPRWVLRSRTRLGSFLSKPFHVKRTGSCPSSAIFPLPAPRLGLFEPQGSPSTSATQWKKLCLQRALHVVVMALNFVHNGLRFPDLDLLGRCPNALQLSVFRRLRALWLRVTFLVDSLSLLAGPVLNSLRVLSSSSILPALFLR